MRPESTLRLTAAAIARSYAIVAQFEDVGEEYERVLRRVFQAVLRPGDMAIDVGAHVGKHSIPMAVAVAPGGTVVAVEPIPWAADRLAARLESAGLDRDVQLFRGCCGSSVEPEVAFHIVPDHPGWSSLHVRERVAETEEILVPQQTIDEVAGTRVVRCIKVDVEGAEVEVLRGARRVLAQHRPVVHVEVSVDALERFGKDASAVRYELSRTGHRLFDLLGNDVTDPELWSAATTSPGMFDFVAVHPDDPALDDVLAVLARSFADERLDLSRHGVVELLPAIPDRPSSETPAQLVRDDPMSMPPVLLDGPTPAKPSVWPSSSDDVMRFAIEWTGAGAMLLDFDRGEILDLCQPREVELPVTCESLVIPDEREIRFEFVTPMAAGDHHQTLIEARFLDGTATAIARVHRMRKLEVLWIAANKANRRSSIEFTEAQKCEIVLGRTGLTYRLRALTGERACQVTFDVAKADQLIALTIGRRAHWANAEEMDLAQVVLTTSVRRSAGRTRLGALLRRVARHVPTRVRRSRPGRALARRIRAQLP